MRWLMHQGQQSFGHSLSALLCGARWVGGVWEMPLYAVTCSVRGSSSCYQCYCKPSTINLIEQEDLHSRPSRLSYIGYII